MNQTDQMEPSQQTVAAWFDRTYATKGFGYLRPYAAYPIYLQLLGAQAGQRILDVGCGAGLLLKAARDRGLRAVGVDISQMGAKLAEGYAGGAKLTVANAQFLPYADASFDFVTSIGAIERFIDRQAALREMVRVAAPQAKFCFMVRNSQALTWTVWSRWLGQRNRQGHQDALTLQQWRDLFERTGFAIEAVHMDQWLRQRLRRWLRAGRQPDFTRPEPVARPILPLRMAYEFIFLMRKA